jgi:hypothetical protein
VEEVSIVNVHPGAIFTPGAKDAGYTEDSIPCWDDSMSIHSAH